jgi:hypothetical protein
VVGADQVEVLVKGRKGQGRLWGLQILFRNPGFYFDSSWEPLKASEQEGDLAENRKTLQAFSLAVEWSFHALPSMPLGF